MRKLQKYFCLWNENLRLGDWKNNIVPSFQKRFLQKMISNNIINCAKNFIEFYYTMIVRIFLHFKNPTHVASAIVSILIYMHLCKVIDLNLRVKF